MRKARPPIGGRASISRRDGRKILLASSDRWTRPAGKHAREMAMRASRGKHDALLALFHALLELGQAGAVAKRFRFHEEQGVSHKMKSCGPASGICLQKISREKVISR
jgi:hypothetical protein